MWFYNYIAIIKVEKWRVIGFFLNLMNWTSIAQNLVFFFTFELGKICNFAGDDEKTKT